MSIGRDKLRWPMSKLYFPIELFVWRGRDQYYWIMNQNDTELQAAIDRVARDFISNREHKGETHRSSMQSIAC
jgi:hypothetical protein